MALLLGNNNFLTTLLLRAGEKGKAWMQAQKYNFLILLREIDYKAT